MQSHIPGVVDDWLRDTLNRWEEEIASLENGIFTETELPALPGDVSYRQFMDELRTRIRTEGEK
jgi:hypothetical protein